MKVHQTAICNGCNTELAYHAELDMWLHTEISIEEAWNHKAVPDLTTIRPGRQDVDAVQLEEE